MAKFTNLILACGHIITNVVFNSLDHQIGEEARCSICGYTSITEVESTYEQTIKE